MRVIQGIAANLTTPKLYRIGHPSWFPSSGHRNALVTDIPPRSAPGVGALVTSADSNKRLQRLPTIANVRHEDLSQLSTGDVVLLKPDGEIVQLWDADSEHNAIMVTNVCNCCCVMCPQPSAPDSPGQLQFNLDLLRLAQGSCVKSVSFTGGEPTLRLEQLCALLQYCKRVLPKTTIALLTNGRAFADWDTARRVALAGHPTTMYCVSLQADIASIHDEMMGVTGSFHETVAGLQNLARLGQPVEIRTVITALNYSKLPDMAEFIYRNFPFAQHVAFIGMETAGLAATHLHQLWIEPLDYRDALVDAVRHLHRRDMNVSIYNIPLCLLPALVWRFAKDSISNWKKSYQPMCVGCAVAAKCGGFFSTSNRQPSGIKPVIGISRKG